jgi:hypothetical protein
MLDLDDQHAPALLLIAVLALVGVLLFVSSAEEMPQPPIHDALDGVYENADCPSFQIKGGRLSFEGGELSGRVERGKSSLYLETERALRYDNGPDGCRFVVVDQGTFYAAERKEFASPVIMIQLFSVDRSRSMYWTRTGAPES